MIAALVTLEGKKQRGVGNQNFQYAPGFKEFMLILRSHSLHAYEFVSKHIPMMEDRSILCVGNPTVAGILLICIKGGSMSSAPHGSLQSYAPGCLTWSMTTSKSYHTLDQSGYHVMIQNYHPPFNLIGTVTPNATSSWAALVTRFRYPTLNRSGN